MGARFDPFHPSACYLPDICRAAGAVDCLRAMFCRPGSSGGLSGWDAVVLIVTRDSRVTCVLEMLAAELGLEGGSGGHNHACCTFSGKLKFCVWRTEARMSGMH